MKSKKIKLIYSEFDEPTGVSTVVLATPYGNCTGYAFLHPEDRKYASGTIGCSYACERALQKYLKAHTKKKKEELKVLTDFYNSIKNMRDFNPEHLESKKLKEKITSLTEDIKEYKEDIINSEIYIKNQEKIRQKIRENIQKFKEEKEEEKEEE